MKHFIHVLVWVFLFGSFSILPSAYASSGSGAKMSQNRNDDDDDQGSKDRHLWDYKKKFFNLYSLKDDIRLGEQVMREQINEFKKSGIGVDSPRDAALKARVERIVKRLAAVSDIPNLPYEVHIFDRPDIVNAFCMPGGKIGIYTGLFDKEKGLVDINSDDQIAAVLGHEIAHATLRHVTRRISKMQGLGLLGTVASVAIGQGLGGNIQNGFDQIFSLGVNLYLPSYSRKYESNADQTGFYYMSKARFNPQAAIDLWKKAASKGGPNAKKTSFFASHPSDASRAKALQGWLSEATDLSKGKMKK